MRVVSAHFGRGEEASRDMSPVKYNIKGFNNISGDGCSVNVEHYALKNLARFKLKNRLTRFNLI
jgi:hypothetical protein